MTSTSVMCAGKTETLMATIAARLAAPPLHPHLSRAADPLKAAPSGVPRIVLVNSSTHSAINNLLWRISQRQQVYPQLRSARVVRLVRCKGEYSEMPSNCEELKVDTDKPRFSKLIDGRWVGPSACVVCVWVADGWGG